MIRLKPGKETFMENMVITEIKAKRIYAEPGKYCYVAEAEVEDGGKEVYVAMQKYNGYDMTVSTESMYSFIAGDGGSIAENILEDYDNQEDAAGSRYGDVFELLKDIVGRLG